MNREEWLLNAVENLRPWYKERNYEIPEMIRVSCGWPSKKATSPNNRRVGECVHHDGTKDKIPQIFISPLISDSFEALSILSHELIHAILPADAKHGPAFKRASTLLGLEGKATSNHPGEALSHHLHDIIEKMGDYPHVEVLLQDKDKKQSTRMLKLSCESADHGEEGAYILRTTQKMIDWAIPDCPVCGQQMEVESRVKND